MTVTVVTTATVAGPITNTATVVGNEAEANAANNTSSATLQVNAPFTPPKAKPPVKHPAVCTAIVAAPHSIYVGRNALLRLKVMQAGKGIRGIHVRIAGSTLALVTRASNSKGIVTVRVNAKRAGIVRFAPVAHKQCKASRIGVVGVFTPPVTG